MNIASFSKFSPYTISSTWNRTLHLSIIIVISVILFLAWYIKPSPEGKRTHEKLGLPSCIICKLFGIQSCPSCGLTTAMCYLAKGKVSKAIEVHPASPFVFVVFLTILGYSIFIIIFPVNWLHFEVIVVSSVCSAFFLIWLLALGTCCIKLRTQ